MGGRNCWPRCWQLLMLVAAATSSAAATFRVVENSPTGMVVGTVNVSGEVSGSLDYRFEGVFCQTYFLIGNSTGIITVLNGSNLDREAIREVFPTEDDVHTCFVRYDSSGGLTNVKIEILDLNDCVPHFFELTHPHRIRVSENVALPSLLLLLQPTDGDKGLNGTTEFSISSGNELGYFNISLDEGETAESTDNRVLFLVKPLNFDGLSGRTFFNLTITIRDMGAVPLSFDQQINIQVVDIGDEVPNFELTSYSFEVAENYPVGSNNTFARVRATSDSRTNILYEICASCLTYNSVKNIIGLNNVTGELFFKRPVDFETTPKFQFQVRATNTNSRRFNGAQVLIDIADLNEHPPYFACIMSSVTSTRSCTSGQTENFNNSVVFMKENSGNLMVILFLQVRDADSNATFQLINRSSAAYQLSPEGLPFFVKFTRVTNLDFSAVWVNGSLDREQTPNFTLVISIENLHPPALQTDTTIIFNVLDVNDNTPEFTQVEYTGSVFEGSPVGLEVLRVHADDPDAGENGTVTYSITSISSNIASDWFQISEADGTISIRDASTLNYFSLEGTTDVIFNVIASDNGLPRQSSSTTVTISLLPSATFIPGSYQEYSGTEFNLLSHSNGSLYMEFRSSTRNGLLAYQMSVDGDVFIVQLQDGAVAVRRGQTQMMSSNSAVSNDVWHSLHVQWTNNQISNLIVEPADSMASRLDILQDLSLQRCIEVNPQSLNRNSSLYIGGVNLFQVPHSSLPSQTSFMGVIRNVVVGGTRLDSLCPVTEVNTAIGVIKDHGCANLQCSSERGSQCVDYADQSYCQCRGGFSAQTCSSNETTQEMPSFGPIRFKGSTMVGLSLGYSFFYDLAVQGNGGVIPGGETVVPPAPVQRRRKKRQGGMAQEVELRFRLVELRSAVLLYSRTSSSIHLIRLVHEDTSSSIIYSIWTETQTTLSAPAINISLTLPLEPRVEYHLRATTDEGGAYLMLNEKRENQTWEDNPVTPFVEQPQTDIGVGGASDSLVNTSDSMYSYFVGCMLQLHINSIELPLNGLLSARPEDGGFQVDDRSGVDNLCNLCDLVVCPESSMCKSDNIGGVQCDCQGGLVLADNGRSCQEPTVPTIAALLTAAPQSSLVSYVGGAAGAAVLLLVGVVVIIIIVIIRRRQERQKSTYNINTPTSMGTPRPNKPSNVYTPTTPKRKPSLTSSTNANADRIERGSSISTFQEHDREPEPETPTHKRSRHMSVESGIKMDMDHEASIGRGIPQMDDSGHEVNSTDSARSVESEDIPSSCCNEQIPAISLRMVANLSSPDQYSRSPHTPLTPKEQKIMIPLRPASTNLSQSEYGDEATDTETESFNLRVSSSSGVGGSMQNQGRGSDSEKSGCSTLQWYKASTHSDTERENERIQANRSYFPMHPAPPHPEEMRNYLQSQFKPSSSRPPIYYSPPSFSDHMTGSSYSRPRSKSMHTTTPSPLTTAPQRYENYPHIFTSEHLRNGRMVYERNIPDPSYESTAQRNRQTSDSRAHNEQSYTPTSFTRQYSDPRIPHSGTYCIPRKQNELQPLHNRQMSDPRVSSQQTQDSILVQPRSSRSMRHIPSPSKYIGKKPPQNGSVKNERLYYTLGRIPDHAHYTTNQPGRSFSSSDAPHSEEPFQTLSSLSKIDPISKWDAQARMKMAVDQMDPCHLLSGPYMQFEDVSTDPSVIESQLTMDESIMGEHQVFESQGGGEGTADMLNPLDMRLARLREDEIDSILTDSDIGRHEMNHFPSADCSSQYTATIVAGSTSTSGESTPKMQKVFVIPPSQQSFDV